MMFGCVILCSAYQLFQAYCSGVHEPDVGINTIYRIYLLQISTRRRLHAGRREDSEVYATSGESTVRNCHALLRYFGYMRAE